MNEMFKIKTIFYLFVLNIFSPPVFSQTSLIGFPNIIDGDTLEISNQRVRLHGIDAPELKQVCSKNGKKYKCGKFAKIALQKKIGASKIQCYADSVDRYERLVSICYLNKLNLNLWMVKSGWALAYRRYSSAYTDAEFFAKNEKLGIWSGAFIVPSAWRQGKRSKTNEFSKRKHKKCRIKGNISRTGNRIFHKPEDRDYSKTKIDPDSGERWFCSEKAAQRAGWRRAKR